MNAGAPGRRCPRASSRRAFLKHSALALAAAPQVLTTFLLNGRAAPGNRITLGCIGLGWKGFEGCWGSLLQSFIALSDCRILAVCDVDRRYRERARNFVDQTYGNHDCASHVDFREVLARPEVDAVVIATPDHWHALMTVYACRAGKDVYCEKPLALTIREARAMVTAARQHARVVQTGSQSRSNARLRFGCEVVRRGRIGQVKEVFATCGGPPAPCYLPAESTPDYLEWDLWLGPAPVRPYHHQIHPVAFRGWEEYAGGGIADWGAHHFDLAQWALGMDQSGPVEIVPPDGPAQPHLAFRYANGVVMYHSGPDVGQGVTFVGTEGKVNLMGVTARATFEPARLGESLKDPEVQGHDVLSNKGHCGNFLECIRTRRRPAADVELGCRSVTLCHLATIAYRLGRPLRWNPEREEFVNDPEASRYLDRARREPWQL